MDFPLPHLMKWKKAAIFEHNDLEVQFQLFQ